MPFILAGLFTGLAILTKGPVALLIVGLCGLAFWIGRRFRPFFTPVDILAFIIAVAAVSLAWFGPETIQHGPWFLKSFLQYQFELLTQGVAGHEQPFYYHTLVLLLGCFPVSIIAIKGFKKRIAIDNRAEVAFKLWMKILFWVVLILFSIVKTKIVHYSSLCWLPLTFLAAYAIEQVGAQKFTMERVLKVVLVLMGLIMAVLLTAVPLLFINAELKTWLLAQIKDDFRGSRIFTAGKLERNRNPGRISLPVAAAAQLDMVIQGKIPAGFSYHVYCHHNCGSGGSADDCA